MNRKFSLIKNTQFWKLFRVASSWKLNHDVILLIYLLVYLFANLFIYVFIYLFIYLFI